MTNLLHAFPDAEVLREQGGDVMYCDRDFYPHCGFMSLREVAILSDVAAKVTGRWCEIGSHVGWSAAHVAASGRDILMVDPEYRTNHQITKRLTENLTRAGVVDRTNVCCMMSNGFFALHGKKRFDGVLIDGCHDAPVPVNDAIGADRVLNPGGVIVLHDSRGQPVKDAVDWLEQQGYRVERHDTMNGLAVCWKPKAAA